MTVLRDIALLAAYAAWLLLAVHSLTAGLYTLAVLTVAAAPAFWARHKRHAKDEQPDAHMARQAVPQAPADTDAPDDTALATRPGYAAYQGSIRLTTLATTDTEGSPQ